jgi:hypothetical protein
LLILAALFTWVTVWIALGIAFFVPPFLIILVFPAFSTAYIFKAYLSHSTTPSQSCYFMPCAPQKILDHDQIGALFVGIIIFLGAEVVYPLIQRLKRRRRERRGLRQDLDEADLMIQLARMNRSEEARENPPPLVRVASGFEAEDGVASTRNAAGRVG